MKPQRFFRSVVGLESLSPVDLSKAFAADGRLEGQHFTLGRLYVDLVVRRIHAHGDARLARDARPHEVSSVFAGGIRISDLTSMSTRGSSVDKIAMHRRILATSVSSQAARRAMQRSTCELARLSVNARIIALASASRTSRTSTIARLAPASMEQALMQSLVTNLCVNKTTSFNGEPKAIALRQHRRLRLAVKQGVITNGSLAMDCEAS